MAEIKDSASFETSLSPEQKAFFENYLPTVKTSAVEEFKTTSEAERKKLVPEKYELKFKDESLFDPKEDAEKIAAYARERGFSGEQAQQFVDFLHERVSGFASRSQQTVEQAIKEWETQTWADKDLGGANRSATEQDVQRALTRFGTEDLRKMLNDTGLGNNIHVVRLLRSIGRAMKEDSMPLNARAGAGHDRPKTEAEKAAAMYPSMAKS